jgi:hypothetical protein
VTGVVLSQSYSLYRRLNHTLSAGRPPYPSRSDVTSADTSAVCRARGMTGMAVLMVCGSSGSSLPYFENPKFA